MLFPTWLEIQIPDLNRNTWVRNAILCSPNDDFGKLENRLDRIFEHFFMQHWSKSSTKVLKKVLKKMVQCIFRFSKIFVWAGVCNSPPPIFDKPAFSRFSQLFQPRFVVHHFGTIVKRPVWKRWMSCTRLVWGAMWRAFNCAISKPSSWDSMNQVLTRLIHPTF